MLILRQAEVSALLDGRERELVDLVREAYRLYDEGQAAVPHSVFLRFPRNARNRIIGLPAYLGGPQPVAGMKWISSFPGNLDSGLQRASAAILLNSLATGQPEALIEGSVISARRTAASAALAASVLTTPEQSGSAALLGCGVINFEVLRFLAAVLPNLRAASVFDRDQDRAESFRRRAAEELPDVAVEVAPSAAAALRGHRLHSIATTAAEPHMGLDDVPPGSVLLHVSLRDLYPAAILSSVNVVDDADHVCRERTSLHLTEQVAGNRDFIHASLGRLVRDPSALRRTPQQNVVFSPFGLGMLDLALADYVRCAALDRGLGTRFDDFLLDGGALVA
ncbi:2,3-diaminopropionate biosynthesis protein SbnB [Actinospica robiniae]|uniref:2,3-diaminopropionate biosynthesis protein SbnB n=1 Tax=Actinospica robiniae TaxID=304901 RepID=UPI000416F368|nr:2,3-diaminopropionate biosynthesis protein SbnB [Actinospica robiniae]